MGVCVQANDKEAFLHRFVAVEGTLQEAISRQLAAEAGADTKMAAHAAQMDCLAVQQAEAAEAKEAVLREQMEAAMRRLRAYAREVEQNMESARSRH
jgi:hypothetical protein